MNNQSTTVSLVFFISLFILNLVSIFAINVEGVLCDIQCIASMISAFVVLALLSVQMSCVSSIVESYYGKLMADAHRIAVVLLTIVIVYQLAFFPEFNFILVNLVSLVGIVILSVIKLGTDIHTSSSELAQ